MGYISTPPGGEGGFYGYFPLGKLVLWLLPAGEVGFRVTPRWGRGWVGCVLPTGGEDGFYGYFPQGKLVFGFFPALGKLVSGLLPAGGQGGLHEYSPLGERVGCMVTSRRVSEVIICECNSCLSVLLFFPLAILFACGILFPLLYSYYYLNSFLCLPCSSMLSGLELYCSNFLT